MRENPGFSAWVFAWYSFHMAKTESGTLMQKGTEAPEFKLPAVDGATYVRKDFEFKEGMFVLFMCNHCPYVKARIAEIVALHKEFGGNIAFVGINSNDPDYPGEGMEKRKEFAKEHGIEFPYLLDEDGVVARVYGATCTPDPFLFGKDMKLVFHGRLVDALEPVEAVKERTMQNVMKKMLAGGGVDPWFDPSLGCSIKFKS